ncbi:MAG: hypothetical protein ABS79_00085 [Planctomycetes bacterium SCN 63-9]|nr:MAG: hypothetical protein ABS79_00085 [Planctomycetes bacterium SCN 63-9]
MPSLFNLSLIVLFATLVVPAVAIANPPNEGTLASPLSNEEAWKRLPPVASGGDAGKPLPSWARMLAGTLPRTTAAFLSLDNAQRTRSPLDPKLRARMRWVSAHINHSPYAEAVAIFDARRAGLDDAEIAALRAGDFSKLPPGDRAALEFARKMTEESAAVTDAEFANLVKAFGEKRAASMVLLMAYSNFQDRFLICLGAPIEPGGPLPPVDVSFDPNALAPKGSPPKPAPKTPLAQATGSDQIEDAPDWIAANYNILQDRLENQRRRPTRLRVPAWEEVIGGLPAGLFNRPSLVVWNRVCLGYAPELAVPFELLMRTAGSEIGPRWDRIFGQGLFWVTTKAVNCSYCMGHCEMNWEVAGLTKPEIAERSKLLSGGDWSSFPPAEQHAYAFARKLSRSPGSIEDADIQTLKQDNGPERALFIALNASRYHYMTRISNGFQLTLERDNVFYDYYNVKPPTPAASEPAVALLSDAECWKRMPQAVSGSGQPLPSWAKGVAAQMPRTAAAMLALDLAQRTKSPLDPKLRAKMRWVIAAANRCAYSEAYAIADLKRAGGDDADVATLIGNSGNWPEADRDPLDFARQLTVSASTIPDPLFAKLRERFGDKKVASMVLLAAYGNFQDRIVLGLGLPLEEGGPLPPLEVEFAPGALQSRPVLPDQKKLPRAIEGGSTVVEADREWSELPYERLQARLEGQRARTPRLPVPTWDEVKKGLPPEFAARPTRIVWNLVCSGYVPELAVPWSRSTRTHWAELPQDRVFEESLFWIQTRSIRCNYCMGHCEMLLEVAGLDKDGVADRTRRLAGDDWSSFPPAEQRTYAYARKLSKTPWDLTAADYRTLEKDLGEGPAMSVFWWLCRGLYMTRVSDGFQLPLERDNVFQDLAKAAKDAAQPKP